MTTTMNVSMQVMAEGFIEECLEQGLGLSDIVDEAYEKAEDSVFAENVEYCINNPEETELSGLLGSTALDEFQSGRETVTEMWDDWHESSEYYSQKYGKEASEWIPSWIESFDSCPSCQAELFIDKSKEETYCPFCT